MDGNEVRRLVFPQSGGYDTAAVDELLDRIAAELDAGRPVAELIEDATLPRQSAQLRRGFRGGYVYSSVDGVLSQLRRQDDPEARADPWWNLPAWRYSMASPDASAGELAGSPRHGAAMLRVGRVQAAKYYAWECAEACRDFGAQPGTRLGLVKLTLAHTRPEASRGVFEWTCTCDGATAAGGQGPAAAAGSRFSCSEASSPAWA